MHLKKTILATVMMVTFAAATALAGSQPGTTDTVFNRKFFEKIKPMMPYEQLVTMIGTAGAKVTVNKPASPANTVYHWDGGRKSALDIKVDTGKVVEATVTSPKNKKFTLGK